MRKSTLVFIILSGVASACNYATYPILARLLSADQFVDITVALALFTQLSSFMVTIVALTVGLTKQGDEDAKSSIEKLQAVLTHLFLVLIVTFLVSSPLFFSHLHIPAIMFMPIGGMLILSIFMSVVSGYLNGKQEFVKLGVAVAVSAFLQLAVSTAVALTTRNGSATLYGMTGGYLASIVALYWLYRKANLPQPTSIFKYRFATLYKSKKLVGLVRFTIAASCAALITNLLMIVDLLLVNDRGTDTKVYADLYVISRIVYFAGLLFIWPFLSNIDLRNGPRNMALLAKLTSLFGVISGGAILTMYFFGDLVTGILLGSPDVLQGNGRSLAVLAILYKFVFLLLTTLVLFFVVMRSYWSVILPLVLAITTGVAMLAIHSYSSTQRVVALLNIAASVGLVIGLGGFVLVNTRLKTGRTSTR